MAERKPTQGELISAIYDQSLDLAVSVTQLKDELLEVKKQVKYTNGKVAGLIEKDIRREERDKVLVEMASTPVVVKKETTTEVRTTDPKAVAAGIAFVMATIGQIWLTFKGGL